MTEFLFSLNLVEVSFVSGLPFFFFFFFFFSSVITDNDQS